MTENFSNGDYSLLKNPQKSYDALCSLWIVQRKLCDTTNIPYGIQKSSFQNQQMVQKKPIKII